MAALASESTFCARPLRTLLSLARSRAFHPLLRFLFAGIPTYNNTRQQVPSPRIRPWSFSLRTPLPPHRFQINIKLRMITLHLDAPHHRQLRSTPRPKRRRPVVRSREPDGREGDITRVRFGRTDEGTEEDDKVSQTAEDGVDVAVWRLGDGWEGRGRTDRAPMAAISARRPGWAISAVLMARVTVGREALEKKRERGEE